MKKMGKHREIKRIERRGCWLGVNGILSYGLGTSREILLTDEERKNFERVKNFSD